MIARRLLAAARGGGSFTTPSLILFGLYNGTTADFDYDIGMFTSTDGGDTFTKSLSDGGPVITKGTAGTWDDETLAQPTLFWDPVRERWVTYIAGHNGSIWQIGRWFNDNENLVGHETDWTPDAGNPVLTPGGGFSQMNIPTTLYDAGSDITRGWYAGWSGSTTTLGYFEVVGTSGTLSGPGQVLGLGGGGAFDEDGLAPGPVLDLGGGTWCVYYAGLNSSGFYHTGYATTTDPDNSGAYSKVGVISAFSGTASMDGRTWRSIHLRSIITYGAGYRGFLTLFHPTDASGDEISAMSTSTDGITWTTPTGPIVSLGTWDSNSAENPAVARAP